MNSKFMMIVGCTVCFATYTMQQPTEITESASQAAASSSDPQQKEREEKAQQALALPQTIPLHGVRRRGPETQEAITVADTEPVTAETFEELIARQREHQDPFVLARVVTVNPNGRENIHYFDAYNLNRWRFGEYPFSGRRLEVVQETNPLNRLTVQDLQYFSYDPAQPEQGFTFSFTENDIRRGHRSVFLRYWLEANQNVDTPAAFELKSNALLRLGNMYLNGLGVPINYTQARMYFEKAAQQTESPAAQAEALVELGNIYYSGLDVERDYARAFAYLQHAIQLLVNPISQAKAALTLGILYLYGWGVPVDLAQARAYLEQVSNQTVDLLVQTAGQHYLQEVEKRLQEQLEQPPYQSPKRRRI